MWPVIHNVQLLFHAHNLIISAFISYTAEKNAFQLTVLSVN